MYVLTKADYLLVKNSTNWATRSTTKLRTYFNRKYGSHIRDLMLKSVNCTNEIEDMYDKFVTTGESKTKNDSDALSKFTAISTSYDNFANHIVKVIIPELNKHGIQISIEDLKDKLTDKDDEEKVAPISETTNKATTSTPTSTSAPTIDPIKSEINRQQMFEDISRKLIDLGSLPIPELSEKDRAFQLLLISTEKQLSKTKDLLADESVSDKNVLGHYVAAVKKLEMLMGAFFILTKNTKADNIYSSLIKTATTIEEASAYYLLSLGDYGGVRTPIKEKLLAIKNFIGLGIDPTIDNLRSDCIKYTKELIKESERITDVIEIAAKHKGEKEPWVNLMKQYNSFADIYNTYRPFYINLYSALKIKINQDKILKSKKDKKINKGDAAMRDFVDYSWTDLPASAANKFPILKKIGG